MKIQIPEKFQPYVGEYGVVATDGKEPVGWGYPIIGEKMGEEMWMEFGQLGKLDFDYFTKKWTLVTQTLSDAEAISKYGPITNVEYGPRGGYKSITFGSTRFKSKLFKR